MKYTAAFALPAVALAAWLTHTEGPRRFGLMAACAAFTFLALCPWPLLQPAAFFNDLEAVRAHYSGGHLGAQGTGNWGWYLHKLAENDGLSIAGVCLFAAGGLGTLAGVFRNGRDSRHSRSHLLPFALFLCALLWLAWLGTVKVRFERNMLNAVVPASVAAGCGLAELATALRGRFPPRVGWAAACLALFLLAITAAASLRLSLRLAGDDTRELAAAWISEHVEAGAHIVREAYTPRPDPGRYRVEYSWSLAHHGPAWYRAQGVDYLLASYAVWGRLLDSGSQQSARGNYMDILALPVVADFQPGPRTMGPPLTIHRIDRKNGPSRLR
jgi:hypothetical protein